MCETLYMYVVIMFGTKVVVGGECFPVYSSIQTILMRLTARHYQSLDQPLITQTF